MATKVLIVEDSPSQREFVTALLLSNGMEVSSAYDGLDAIEKVLVVMKK
jgi:twitching motility two-component system response regulator PilH